MHITFKIVEFLGSRPSYPNEVARKLSISPSQAQKWLVYLLEKGMLIRDKGDMKRIFYRVNVESQRLIGYRRFILAENLESSEGWQKIKEIGPCGIYGSMALGTFDGNSDIDLWVWVEKEKRTDVRKWANRMEEEFRRPVNVVYLTDAYLRKMLREEPEFFYRLKFQSVTEAKEVFNVA